MEATLKTYRQSPRKVRLVAELVRGRRVVDALAVLEHTNKQAAGAVKKLLESAAANARANHKQESGELAVAAIFVDQGRTLKRFRAMARGRGARINKRTSHIHIALGPWKPKSDKN